MDVKYILKGKFVPQGLKIKKMWGRGENIVIASIGNQ